MSEEQLLLQQMNDAVKHSLNPLFKIAQVKIVDSLPRTASNKIMRRELRQRFIDESCDSNGA